MVHLCVSNLTIIGSDNGFPPGRHQAIIWANAGILLLHPKEQISNFTPDTFSFTKNAFENIVCKNVGHFISASMCQVPSSSLWCCVQHYDIYNKLGRVVNQRPNMGFLLWVQSLISVLHLFHHGAVCKFVSYWQLLYITDQIWGVFSEHPPR